MGLCIFHAVKRFILHEDGNRAIASPFSLAEIVALEINLDSEGIADDFGNVLRPVGIAAADSNR
jgi:hypothetical protein